jgi:hypothetical protein
MQEQPKHGEVIVQLDLLSQDYFNIGLRAYSSMSPFEEIIEWNKEHGWPLPNFWWVPKDEFPLPKESWVDE